MDASQIIYHRDIVNYDILKKATDKYGPDGYIFGRDYIVKEHCNINEI